MYVKWGWDGNKGVEVGGEDEAVGQLRVTCAGSSVRDMDWARAEPQAKPLGAGAGQGQLFWSLVSSVVAPRHPSPVLWICSWALPGLTPHLPILYPQTLFNPNKTVVKMFLVTYDFQDMPANHMTFLRHRIFLVPVGEEEGATAAPSKPPGTSPPRRVLCYLMHLR